MGLVLIVVLFCFWPFLCGYRCVLVWLCVCILLRFDRESQSEKGIFTGLLEKLNKCGKCTENACDEIP